MRAEHSWSLLDPKPIILYLKKHDEYIVYWNGWAMTHSQALCLAMEQLHIYPTPSMKSCMEFTFAKLYWAGAFNTTSWDQLVKTGSTYSIQKNALSEHIRVTCQGKRPVEILSWFDYSRARIEENSD